MVGPFVQGMFLIGIIYWYSKGMMSMINDYYRSEFQRKLQTEGAVKQPAKGEAPVNVDNFMDYVREMDTPPDHHEHEKRRQLVWRQDYSFILLRFLEITGSLPALEVCWNGSSSVS
ncbi:uncharacterized protein Xport-B [Drosophila tropicalis]|uniref:uncharacterized protein Xport-B n=1 Tax=Drosophila tropicalis TaxID=46794 RepID=UPI0035ABB837